jgi:hypothetical protein
VRKTFRKIDESIDRNKHDSVLLKAAKSMLQDRVNYIELFLLVEENAEKIADPKLKEIFITAMEEKIPQLGSDPKLTAIDELQFSIWNFKRASGWVF